MKRETAVKTPYFLVDEERLVKNLELLKEIQEETDCRILLAQKAFSGLFRLSADAPVPGRNHRQRPLRGKAWKGGVRRRDPCVLPGLPGG